MTDIFNDAAETHESIIFASAKSYLAGKGLIGLYGTLVEHLGYSPDDALDAVLSSQRKSDAAGPVGDIILLQTLDQS